MLRFLAVVALGGVLILPSAACSKSPTSPTSATPSTPAPTVIQAGPVPTAGGPINSDDVTGTRGTISNLTGDRNSFQFMIGGNMLVRGDATTDILGAPLTNGVAASVTGSMRGDHLFATKISVN